MEFEWKDDVPKWTSPFMGTYFSHFYMNLLWKKSWIKNSSQRNRKYLRKHLNYQARQKKRDNSLILGVFELWSPMSHGRLMGLILKNSRSTRDIVDAQNFFEFWGPSPSLRTRWSKNSLEIYVFLNVRNRFQFLW